jgi:D-alanyl-D-alanine dipeptidase
MKATIIAILFILTAPFVKAQEHPFDKQMQEYGLVDIQTLDSSILVELKYSTTDNFVGKDMYGALKRSYLEATFAAKVVRAQQVLKRRNSNYTLLIYDAARPISVQRTMRKMVEGTDLEDFVADGTRGGRHNYGVAVDLTIATLDGEPLDMGAGFDDFSDAASVKGTPDTSDPATRTIEVYRTYINNMAKQGVISLEAAKNRILLMEVMLESGLVPYRREWWHFEELMSMSDTRNTYRLLDF